MQTRAQQVAHPFFIGVHEGCVPMQPDAPGGQFQRPLQYHHHCRQYNTATQYSSIPLIPRFELTSFSVTDDQPSLLRLGATHQVHLAHPLTHDLSNPRLPNLLPGVAALRA